MSEDTKQYRFVGEHADNLASGRPIEPGEFVDLTDDDVRDPFNEAMIADGLLIGTGPSATHQVKLAESRIARRTSADDDSGEEN